MIKQDVKYVDFDGNEKEETLYFHLTQAEAIEMETSVQGGMSNAIPIIAKKQDPAEMIAIIKGLILKAYGEKTPDGRFVKNQIIRDAFAATEAYSALFMELTTDADAAA